MNAWLFTLSICITFLFFSCSDQEETRAKPLKADRAIVCNQGDMVEYLNHSSTSQICDSDTCNTYFEVWKSLQMGRNNLSSDFLENEVITTRTSLNHWENGISFRICYEQRIGWAVISSCDKFPILLKNDASRFTFLPRNILLSQEQIETTIGKAYYSRIDTIYTKTELKFDSYEKALDSLITRAEVDKLCSGSIYIDDTGDLLMEAYGKYEHEFNSCIYGTIDLITGTTKIEDMLCRI